MLVSHVGLIQALKEKEEKKNYIYISQGITSILQNNVNFHKIPKNEEVEVLV